jgi:cell division transport system permease protein
MKSIKDHISLILALFSILFAVQLFLINDRALNAYEEKLSTNYSMVVVASAPISDTIFKGYSANIEKIEPLSTDAIIAKLGQDISQKNMDLLKSSLPKFYRIHLKTFPSISEIEIITKKLKSNTLVTKVEDFSSNHDTIYKLLILFKQITQLFATVILIVTVLLIAKEMKIWQLQHSERMNIMGLFGAPLWLRSAVLFRLAITDAFIASVLSVVFFYSISISSWTTDQLQTIGIDFIVFEPLIDGSILLGVAAAISILLASTLALGYKEEV